MSEVDSVGPEARRRSRRRRLLWQLVLPTAVVAGTAAAVLGFATAGSSSPTPTPSASAPAAVPHGPGGAWGWAGWGGPPPWAGGGPAAPFASGQPLHGEVVVANDAGGTQTLLIQKGEATKVSASSITLKSSDGYSRTYKVNGDTTLNGEKGKVSSVAANADVVVVAVKQGNDATAVTVVDPGQWKGWFTPRPSHS